MCARAFLTGLVLLLADTKPPPANEIVLRQAEAAFRAGVAERARPEQARTHFRAAADAYEVLRQAGSHNPDLAANQGHAALLAGDLPGAILAYRRGLRLAPQDARLRAALAYARAQVVYSSDSALGRPALEHWPPWLPRPAPVQWFWLAALAYALGCAAGTRWLMVRRGLLVTGSALGVAALATAALLLEEESLRDTFRVPFVVVAEDGVLLRKGNGLAYPPRAEEPLNRGVEARLLFTRGDWFQVELASGEIGWIPRAYALVEES